jgi:hypothetical protein
MVEILSLDDVKDVGVKGPLGTISGLGRDFPIAT